MAFTFINLPHSAFGSVLLRVLVIVSQVFFGGGAYFSVLFLSPIPASLLNMAANRWLKPEVYPLFASVGVAVGICGMQLIRNICTNPEVRVTKENRTAGILDNFAEGEKYSQHSLRKFVRNKTPQIMPSVNKFFSDPN